MSDLYYELLVKKEHTSKDSMIKYGLIGATALAVLIGFFVQVFVMIPAIAGIIACVILIPRTDVEYEYLFVNGDMDIDAVYSKAKRKKQKNVKFQEIEIAAGEKSYRLDAYKNRQNLKVLDYSSGNPQAKRLAVITRDGNDLCKIIIEPDEKLAQMIRNSAPSKVFLDF